MSKLTNEQIQEILDGAPEGATHCCSNNQYWKLKNNEWFVIEEHQNGFFWSNEAPIYIGSLSSISDLREILTLRQQSEVAARAVEEAINGMLHKVANQYEGNDTTDRWCIGANHVFILFALERDSIFKKLREQSDE